jgi:hypothetical protein
MEFFIKKNATLPLLKLQVVKDGRSDYDNFMKSIESSDIFFSMVDTENGIPKMLSVLAGFVLKEFTELNPEPEYYIYYQFKNRDTNQVGRFEGQFMLNTDDGVLILPIREKLFINVQESFVVDNLPYDSNYIIEFPCCDNPIANPTPTPTNPCIQFLTDEFGNYILTENGDFIISEINTCVTPTPTPTLTPTPTNPCVEFITDEFGNYILTEDGDFIISEINPCITPTPTPSSTII